MLVENLCGNFENIFQHMGIYIDDKDLMVEEIKEALFALSSHQKEIVNANCHDDQENIQETIVFPVV